MHMERADLVSEKEEIKSNNIIKQYKNDYFHDVSKENIKECNLNRPQIPDHPYRIVIIRGAGSGINKFFIQSNKLAT